MPAQPTMGKSKASTSGVAGGVANCYCCGREYGLRSISLHEEVCAAKFHEQQQRLPKEQRRRLPRNPKAVATAAARSSMSPSPSKRGNPRASPEGSTDAMVKAYNATLIPCPYCDCEFSGRVHFDTHVRDCALRDAEIRKVSGLPSSTKKAVSSVAGHSATPTMLSSMMAASKASPRDIMRISVRHTVASPERKAAEATMTAEGRAAVIPCYVCGRELCADVLLIHEPLCEAKFEATESVLPLHQRRRLPKKGTNTPVKWHPTPRKSGEEADDECDMGEERVSEERGQSPPRRHVDRSGVSTYVECPQCSRSFGGPERLAVHLRRCNSSGGGGGLSQSQETIAGSRSMSTFGGHGDHGHSRSQHRDDSRSDFNMNTVEWQAITGSTHISNEADGGADEYDRLMGSDTSDQRMLYASTTPRSTVPRAYGQDEAYDSLEEPGSGDDQQRHVESIDVVDAYATYEPPALTPEDLAAVGESQRARTRAPSSTASRVRSKSAPRMRPSMSSKSKSTKGGRTPKRTPRTPRVPASGSRALSATYSEFMARVESGGVDSIAFPSSSKKKGMCYVCGREYGMRSLPLHEETCAKRFISAQSMLPPCHRKPLPTRFEGAPVRVNYLRPESDARTEAMWASYKASLVTCPYCDRELSGEEQLRLHVADCQRKSLQVRLEAEENGSQSIAGLSTGTLRSAVRGSGGRSGRTPARAVSWPNAARLTSTMQGAALAPCHVCGKRLGSHALIVHEPLCAEKFMAEQAALPAHRRKPLPMASVVPAPNRSPFKSASPTKRPNSARAASADDDVYVHVGANRDLTSVLQGAQSPTRTRMAHYDGGGAGSGGGAVLADECVTPGSMLCPQCGRRFAGPARLEVHLRGRCGGSGTKGVSGRGNNVNSSGGNSKPAWLGPNSPMPAEMPVGRDTRGGSARRHRASSTKPQPNHSSTSQRTLHFDASTGRDRPLSASTLSPRVANPETYVGTPDRKHIGQDRRNTTLGAGPLAAAAAGTANRTTCRRCGAVYGVRSLPFHEESCLGRSS